MNKVYLIGNLTRDTESRSTASGVAVCTFSIAVSRRFKNKDGERTVDYFNIVAWKQLGEMCGTYLSKGSKVAVIGELQTRTYDAKDGGKRYITEVIADEVEFLTPKSAAASTVNESAQVGMNDWKTVEDDDLPF